MWEPKLQMRYGRKIIRPKKWIQGQAHRALKQKLKWALNNMDNKEGP